MFKILENALWENSLYRALSIAITGHEYDYPVIQNKILNEMMRNPNRYFGHKESNPSALFRYKRNSVKLNRAPDLIELHAASAIYGFNFIVFQVCYEEQGFMKVTKSWPVLCTEYRKSNTEIPQVITYCFLRTGSSPDTWCYEYMIPAGYEMCNTN